ncbi:hypothetical protein CAI21_21940 [Alkalilimnicola ehrlichii]|uniref:Uncharacterized protein n=1 Tax=Alkalilimnicola ehrlichii TaxID=351052 RepID=A0A3E0WFW2_9GAMM|nr:hypothetical protein [Alkalilimnicola ehrlichii]RFA24372.1 hypothetical protein CAI21_21940 [Alkalilimnicola ehrlichii]RFA31618.1 hypothetical protein CAL65_21985 [Alkalilimnicola ehrlichii]
MNAAIINERNQVVFSAEVAEGVREIEVAGAVDINGYPINRKTFRVSRSKRNLAKAADAFEVPMLSERQYRDLTFYVE